MDFYFELDQKIRYENSIKIIDLLEKSKNIYFIGIGGIGLSALAQLFNKIGKKVSGSDQYESEITSILNESGIKTYIGHNLSNIKNSIKLFGDIDIVIYSPAVNDENIELSYFKRENTFTLTYGQALSYFVNTMNSVSVCGTHGKSSTTAILSEMLIEHKIDTSFLCGAILKKFNTNAIFNKNSKYFIAESCEYKETFLNFFPNNIIIPSLEVDHLDYYKNEENYFNAFKSFLCQLKNGTLVMRVEKDLEKRLFKYAKSLKNIKNILTYSSYEEKLAEEYENHLHFYYFYDEKNPNEVRFEKIEIKNKKQNILLSYNFNINIPSKEYAANFVSVFAFLESLSILNAESLKYAPKYFGIKRRFELLGIDKNNNYVISDYAHHPSEINTLLKIAKLKYQSKKIFLIFQAHQHSRTKYLLDEFLKLFKEVENLIILPIYRQRDSEDDIKNMSSLMFFESIEKVNKNAIYCDGERSIFDFLKNIKDSVFLFTGAGTIDNFAKNYLKFSKDTIE
ncbi:MAG: Mur ligase domain-containing protein [Exilispira sp.]|jgi:UDP-N-acetylmuramate--alanine ligase|nr:Mur ligase domain-containing protein [Exilispira sp.]